MSCCAESHAVELYKPDWLRLPENIWLRIFYNVLFKHRAKLDLVCQKFYNLTPYDDLSISIQSRDIADRMFALLERKHAVKYVKFQYLALHDPSEYVLELLNTKEYIVRELCISLSITASSKFLYLLQGNFSQLVALRLEEFNIPQGRSDPDHDIQSIFIQRFPNLKFLELKGGDFCPSSLPATIEYLILMDIKLPLPLDKLLQNCSHRLETLKLQSCRAQDQAMFQLPFLPKLQSLKCGMGHDTSLIHLLKRGGLTCPALKHLDMGTGYAGFNALSVPEFKNLESLRLIFGPRNPDQFLRSACPTHITELTVTTPLQNGDSVISFIVERLHNLRTLTLCILCQAFNTQFEGEFMKDMFLGCPMLTDFRMYVSFPQSSVALTGLAYAPPTMNTCDITCVLPNSEEILKNLLHECEQREEFPKREQLINLTVLVGRINDTLETIAGGLLDKYIRVRYTNGLDLLLQQVAQMI